MRISSEVAQCTQWILPEKANKGEVSQHLVETVTTKVSSNRIWVPLVVVHLGKTICTQSHDQFRMFMMFYLKLLVDVRLVHQGMEDIQHRVHIPHLARV